MIELLIVLGAIALLAVFILFALKTQIAKGRDARRKADLEKTQKALEDYMNDKGCYPNPSEIANEESKICQKNFSPYLGQLPCDPINNAYFNYFYSYDGSEECKSWYKIYAKLENTKDPIISRVGCADGCGPGGNYNYWIASSNMNKVSQIPGAEDWWPVFPPGGTPTPTSVFTPTPTPTGIVTPTPTPTLPPGVTPTPTSTSTPTPTPDYNYYGYYGCIDGKCVAIWGDCSTGNCQCPNMNYLVPNCDNKCDNPLNECR